MMAILRICIARKYTLPSGRQTSWSVKALDRRRKLRQPMGEGLLTCRRCPMHHQHDPALEQYPHGRGYGHDYMRGGEVLGGYCYSDRDEDALPRGELQQKQTRERRSDNSSARGTDP